MEHERAAAVGEAVPFNFSAASSRDEILYASEIPAAMSGNQLPEAGSITEEMVLPWITHMQSKGIARVILLVDDNELKWYAPPGLISMQQKAFKSVVNIPMCVWNSWDRIYQHILDAEAAQEKILAHCVHGEGRTSRILAAWLMCKYGLSAEGATAEVQSFAKREGVRRAENTPRLQNYVKVGYDDWRKDAVHHPPGWKSRKSFELHRQWKDAREVSPHGTAYPQVVHRQLTNEDIPSGSRVIVIGDVHGCAQTLDLLLQECGHDPLTDKVIFVGDLVHKGPDSVAVVKRARELRALCVRGNHDDAALFACIQRRLAHALASPATTSDADEEAQDVEERDAKRPRRDDTANGSADQPGGRTDEQKSQKPFEYAWTDGLDDDDLTYLADLPYTLRLPDKYDIGGQQREVLIVHAGLVAGAPLEGQLAKDMYKIRDVKPVQASTSASDGGNTEDGADEVKKWEGQELAVDGSVAWVDVWTGPEHVYFGHDANRKLQHSPFATGLDSGACYGFNLSAAILPGGEIKAVSSKPEIDAFINATPKA